MEKQLLSTGEYILLRGKDSYSGLLQRVETNPVSRITGQVITDLYNSVPKAYRKNAVFLMNTVTLNELSRSLGVERDLIACRDDGYVYAHGQAYRAVQRHALYTRRQRTDTVRGFQ